MGLRRSSPAAAYDRLAGQAVDDFYRQYSHRVYGYCVRALGSREEAEDVLQDTYLKAWRSLQSGFRPEAPDAWLLHIARNLCISRHRAAAVRISAEPLEEVALDYGFAWSSRDELFALSTALAELPELQRRAVVLREWRGLSYEEIAAELGLTYSAVATHISRGRRLLAAGLERSLASTLRGGSGFRVVIVAVSKTLLAVSGTATVGKAAAVVAAIGLAVTSSSRELGAPIAGAAGESLRRPPIAAGGEHVEAAARVRHPASGLVAGIGERSVSWRAAPAAPPRLGQWEWAASELPRPPAAQADGPATGHDGAAITPHVEAPATEQGQGRPPEVGTDGNAAHPGEMNNGPPAAGPPAAEPPVGHASNGPDGGQGRPPDEGTDGNAARPGENANGPPAAGPPAAEPPVGHASSGPGRGQGRPPDEGTDGNAAHPGENANGPPAAGPPAAEPPVGHASSGPDGSQGRPPDEGTDGNAAHPGETNDGPPAAANPRLQGS